MRQFLNDPIPRIMRVVIICALLLLPIAYLVNQYDSQTGFTSLICFGPSFEGQRLPEIKAIPHELAGINGYDGQFYAQIALSPALRNPGLADALDNPAYRAKRILMPALAYMLGAGQPALILQAYALINPLCLIFLLARLVYVLRPETLRHFLCVAAVAWTAGSMISIQRSLTDLPASMLMFVAATTAKGCGLGVFALAAAVLVRDTSILGLPVIAWPESWKLRPILKAAACALLVIAPLALWMWYVSTMLPDRGPGGGLAIGIPFSGFGRHLYLITQAFFVHPRVSLVFEILAPLSLCVQALYMFVRPSMHSRIWRIGFAFAILFFCLSAPSMEEQISYTRVMLPLTIAFNIMLLQEPQGKRFPLWFIPGNLGLLFPALQMLASIISA